MPRVTCSMDSVTTRQGDVLCIEDHPAFALFLGLLVPGRIVPAYDLASGLRLAHERKWKWILLDLVLPDSALDQTVEMIPRLVATGARVLVITGYEVEPDRLYALGACGVMIKGDPAFPEKIREYLA